jgi:2-polyprenyl-3-methyl-5-hydroxy-6-metoxy-1,4-benzoquinol methylase
MSNPIHFELLLPRQGTKSTAVSLSAVPANAKILDALTEAGLPPSSIILDVGYGHGWFLMVTAARGLQAVGIDPDAAICSMAQANGVDFRLGYFLGALDPTDRFDAVVFNDVFERLPDPTSAAKVSAHVESRISIATSFLFHSRAVRSTGDASRVSRTF